MSIPLIMAGPATAMGNDTNPANTVAVSACGLAVGILCVIHWHKVMSLVRQNWASVLLVIIVVASISWSIHPDFTFRRSSGYIVTMLAAAYFSSRFTIDQVMKVLSWSFALSAIGSIVFVAIYPQHGIMQGSFLGGNWRGVFSHKEGLGLVMSVGVFVECYIITSSPSRRLQHLGLLGCFFALVVLSQATTALLCAIFYMVSVCIYLFSRRSIGITLTSLVFLGFISFIFFTAYPDLSLSFLGKDATFTGRTAIWPLVLDLISEKPLLGWGYGAMWLNNDISTAPFINTLGWNPLSAHNEFLEVALELGLVGVAVILIIILVTLRRGVYCILIGRNQIGMFLLLFVFASMATGIVESTLVENQTIDWVLFNILSFSAGLEITRQKALREKSATPDGRSILSRTKLKEQKTLRSGNIVSHDRIL